MYLMSTEPETLQISVAEDIKMVDVGPGGVATSPEQSEEDNRIKSEKQLTEVIRLTGRYVEPHKTKSTWVTEADIPFVVAEGEDMTKMCEMPRGFAHSAKALAHSQISTNPLRFFVLPDGKAIINPVIISHTKVPVFKDKEGCMSFPDKKPLKMVPRFNVITVTYQTLGLVRGKSDVQLLAPITETLYGEQSWIWQHECGHLNGVNVYDDDYTPETCAWFGEGALTEEEVKTLYQIKE